MSNLCWRVATVFIVYFLGLATFAFCQDNLIKNVTIASPTAAALAKYGDIPVSYHTGLPQIAVPLYSLKEGNLELPISLSYHASGLRVLEPASWVGAGWSLNAGGVITRSVVDKPDDRGFGSVSNVLKGHYTDYGYNSYQFVSTYPGDPTGTSDGMMANDAQFYIYNTADGEPDMFNFNFPGYSGKFYFRDDRTPVLVPEQDLRIEPLHSGNVYIEGFNIITPDGSKYHFGKNLTPGDGSVDAFEVTSPYTSESGLSFGSCISSWYLNKIESFDNQFSIKLMYQPETYSFFTTAMFQIVYNAPPEKKTFKLVKNFVAGVRLNQVVFANGQINFIPGAVRTDLGNGETFQIDDGVNTNAKTLGAVEINNLNGFCKKFQFTYTYFDDNTTALPPDLSPLTPISTDRKRLRLDQVQEKSCDGTVVLPANQFSYFTPTGNPQFVPRRLTFAQDHWGFYNGGYFEYRSLAYL